MSPEQARGEQLDARTDLFSFGAVLYEMATGTQAFSGATSAVVFDALLHRIPAAPSQRNASIPAGLDRVISKAIAKDRELRYQSATDMRVDLQRLRTSSSAVTFPGMAESAARVTPPSAQALMQQLKVKKHKLVEVLIGLLLFALVAGAIGIWMVRRPTTENSTSARLEPERVLTGHTGWVQTVAFSPDGRWLASGSYDGSVQLWEVATGREVRTLRGYTQPVLAVAFSPDGRWLASSCGGGEGPIKLWEVATGREVRTLSGHDVIIGGVNAVAFSPDGRWLASGSNDSTVKLWEVATGREVRTLSGGASNVWSVAFSPDGRWLASGSVNNVFDKGGRVTIWNVNSVLAAGP